MSEVARVGKRHGESVSEAVRVTEFWENVSRGAAEECWPWTGYQEKGYGSFFWRGRMVGAHELALTFTTGERRPWGFDTCHKCNNPICCNPSHLRFDTRSSNVADMISSGRARPGRFTDQQIEVMRTRYANGAKQTVIASEYGITNGLVSQIVRGLRYRNSPGPMALDP